ncbi:dienelactone hydrolase family protein [Paramicrobacterium chengjingii]|uniref:dienelactone hydrolase family protein n=1 Tax=Paramicrobacterium chengjingii TaxID=2769067 RepID=UPI001420BC6A|nr:dienelactone hydrolase family protein [Microbacterium chengjingii]
MTRNPTTERLVSRDISYASGDTTMIGTLITQPEATPGPAVLLIHDAFGLSEWMLQNAADLAAQGYIVFAADVWGDRTAPADDSEIGPLIASMAKNRTEWMNRIGAAHDILRAQPEADHNPVIAMGYCFGGASALEYLRIGGELRGVVSIHGGLDLLHDDWSAQVHESNVLLCSGANDPMATSAMRDALCTHLDDVGIDWELDLYGGTTHAFTNPASTHSARKDLADYNPRRAAHARAATTRFLSELTIGS